ILVMMEGWNTRRHAVAAQAGGSIAKWQKATLVLGEHHGSRDDVIDVVQGQVTEDIRPARAMGKGGAWALLAVGEAGDGLDLQGSVDRGVAKCVDESDARPQISARCIAAVRAHEDRYLCAGHGFNVTQCRAPAR